MFPSPNPLLDPQEPNWDGCEYSKCGRTDKGVSAFGQVVGIRVRSNRKIGPQSLIPKDEAPTNGKDGEASNFNEMDFEVPVMNASNSPSESRPYTPSSSSQQSNEDPTSFHTINDEIPYCQVLNRLLPPDIRILAWCPNPFPDFSARFSCRERQYKYLFTQPAFTPTIGPAGIQHRSSIDSPAGRRREGWLDIAAMRTAAHKFIGLHDFRNFCKIDASKQIENFERRIFHADIEYFNPLKNPLGYVSKQGFSQYPKPRDNSSRHHDPALTPESSTPTIYAFTLHGSAFLWHQVRHMIAILFLIGQGLEPASLIDDLLDIQKTPCKPQYEMADDAPLILWDCIFPDPNHPDRVDALNWIHVGDYTGTETGIIKAGGRKPDGKYGMGGLVDDMWNVWRGRKMDEILAGSLLDVIVSQGKGTSFSSGEDVGRREKRSQKVFQGGDGPRMAGKYVAVMEKPRMESVEIINAKYARRKGFEQREEVKEQGFRRMRVETGDESVD